MILAPILKKLTEGQNQYKILKVKCKKIRMKKSEISRKEKELSSHFIGDTYLSFGQYL